MADSEELPNGIAATAMVCAVGVSVVVAAFAPFSAIRRVVAGLAAFFTVLVTFEFLTLGKVRMPEGVEDPN